MFPIFLSIPMPRFLIALFARLGVELGDPFQIHTYGVLIALGVFLAIKIITREAQRRGHDPELFMNLALGLLLWGVIGSRLLFVVLDWELYVDRPLAILNIREGGLVFQGGVIGAAIYALVFMRKNKLDFWETCDLVMVGLPFGHALGRMGCLSAGCCYGEPTTMPWGIIFTDPGTAGAPLHVPLHPVQIYEAFGELLIFVGLMYVLRRRQQFTGQVFLLYFIFYPVLRFTVEIFRGDIVRKFFLEAQLGHLLSTSQAISIIELVLAVVLYSYRRRKPRRSSGAPTVGEAARAG